MVFCFITETSLRENEIGDWEGRCAFLLPLNIIGPKKTTQCMTYAHKETWWIAYSLPYLQQKQLIIKVMKFMKL